MYKHIVPSAVVAYLQQQGDGELCNGLCTVTRTIANGNSVLFCTAYVHDVVSGGQHADHADGRAGLNNGSRQRCLIYQYNLTVTNSCNAFCIGIGAVINRYGAIGFQNSPVQIAGINGKAIENGNFHRVPP